jgi:tetratricopeptide (TPR) repeat protein
MRGAGEGGQKDHKIKRGAPTQRSFLPGLLIFLSIPLPLGGCIRPTPVEHAMSLARQHQEEAAVALLRTDLAQHPDDLDARRLLIRLLAVESNLPAARDEVRALAERLPPDDPSPWIELGHALELMHQFDEALAAYQTAAEKAPSSPEGPLEAGTRAAHWGEWEDARTWLEEAIKRGAHSADVWHTLGLVRLNLHDEAGARAAYANGTREDPRAVDCWLGLATVALASHDFPAALAAYDNLLRLRPAWGDGEVGRAWALAQLGRRDEATQALEHAEELGGDAKAIAKQRALLKAAKAPSP